MISYLVLVNKVYVDFDFGGLQQLNMVDVLEVRIILVR